MAGIRHHFRQGVAWDDFDDHELRRHFRESKTDQEIGRALGRTPKAVQHRRQDLGLLRQPARPVSSWTQAEIKEAQHLRSEGWSLRQIGEVLGRTRNSVKHKLRRHSERQENDG